MHETKDKYPKVSLAKLCRLFGVSRQAYYGYNRQNEVLHIEHQLIINEVMRIRGDHPAMGGRKLYEKLQPFLSTHQIKLGRDGLFDLLATAGLLIRRRRRQVQTTFSNHWMRKWPNQIKCFTPTGPNQLWVSDITYWKTGQHILYISLITDAWSHKIVGHHVSETMASIETIQALRSALPCLEGQASRPIHHSDRGSQYCSAGYVKLLQDHHIAISMTETGDPIENAIAERVNGILKEEYLNYYEVSNLKEAAAALDLAVNLYNRERPHMSLGLLTPELVHRTSTVTRKMWRTYPSKKYTFVNQSQD